MHALFNPPHLGVVGTHAAGLPDGNYEIAPDFSCVTAMFVL